MKELVAQTLAARVKDGETLGLGSGSTAELAVLAIGKRIAESKLTVFGVPTSLRTAELADKAGIKVLSSVTSARIDWAFDGADEVDPSFNLIKGRGAMMLNEKIIARRAAEFIVIVTEDKLVDRLGSKFPVPIEVVPNAVSYVSGELSRLGASVVELRQSDKKYGPVISENGNVILDVKFPSLSPEHEVKIKSIVGVVESGLFCGTSPQILVVKTDGVYKLKLAGGKRVEERVA